MNLVACSNLCDERKYADLYLYVIAKTFYKNELQKHISSTIPLTIFNKLNNNMFYSDTVLTWK